MRSCRSSRRGFTGASCTFSPPSGFTPCIPRPTRERVHDLGVTTGERGQERGVDLLAGYVHAGMLEVGGGAGVANHGYGKPEIDGRPHGGVDAHRGHHAGHDELIDPVAPQALLEPPPGK